MWLILALLAAEPSTTTTTPPAPPSNGTETTKPTTKGCPSAGQPCRPGRGSLQQI